MRFSLAPTFLASLLFFSPGAAALSKSKTSRIVAARQHSIPRTLDNRDLIDVCVNVDARVIVEALAPLVEIPNLTGEICLCIDDLDIFLSTYVDATVLSSILNGPIRAILDLLINTDPTRANCPVVPPHAQRACSTEDPCGIVCDPGYVKNGNQCCPPAGCPSGSLSRPKKRRLSSRVTTYEQARSTCGSRQNVCGIAGREGGHDFECIDTTATLDSCGGCMTPHGFLVSSPQASGVDCSALPNVIEVGCVASKCVVNRCKASFVPSEDASRCVSVNVKRQLLGLDLLGDNKVDAVANVDASIADQISAVVNLVIQLGDAASAPSTTTGTVADPSAPAGVGASPSAGGGLTDDVNALVAATLQTTGALLGSPTVSSLVAATNNLVDQLNALLAGLTACDAGSGLLDLTTQIIVDVNILLGSMAQNPITSPPPAGTSPSNPSPTMMPDGGQIFIDLNNLLGKLGLGGLLKTGTIEIDGLGPGLSMLVQGLVDALSLGPVAGAPSGAPSSPSSPSVVDANATATVDPDVLANITAIVQIVLQLGGSQPETNRDLVNAVLDETANLLASKTLTDLVVYLNDLTHAVLGLDSAGTSCGCFTAEVNNLVAQLVVLLDATLGHVESHPITTPPPSGPASGGQVPTTTADGGQILIDLTHLLTALGLGGLLQVGTVEVDGLGPGLSGFVQSLVNALALGPQ
ncbi:hypothetical protein BD626DRAFT_509712 [Schizophyllum amplum]|uniref:Protein CPL1-like domain-containing protein n=1 Tax=Schizophyllum amplum TaxID=97359 RepID=A0A550C2R2_9AGAR|nr:hypothetical protein BD626DRAFT_509712 [Auriculariopsis ampla]